MNDAPDRPRIPIDRSERRESARILREAHLDPMGSAPGLAEQLR